MSDPRGEWFVGHDEDGFFVSNEYGEHLADGRRFACFFDAVEHINKLIENYEPADPPGWEGGFAENH